MHVDCIGDLKRYSIYHEKISHYMMKKGHFKQILIFMHAGRKSRKTYEEEYGDQVQLTRYEQLTQEADIWQSPLASVTDNDGQESTSQSARMSKECVIHAGGKSQKAYEEEYGDQAQLTHYKSLTQETDMLQPALVSSQTMMAKCQCQSSGLSQTLLILVWVEALAIAATGYSLMQRTLVNWHLLLHSSFLYMREVTLLHMCFCPAQMLFLH